MGRETKIKDIKPVLSGLTENRELEKKLFYNQSNEGCIPLSREAIPYYADEPCVLACQLLYDLNIETYTSDAHLKTGRLNGTATIGIRYDTLSEENKVIANRLIELGIITPMTIERTDNTKHNISLDVPITSESLSGEVSDALLKLASYFQPQDVLYGRTTKEEIIATEFKPLGNGKYFWSMIQGEIPEEMFQDELNYKLSQLYSDNQGNYFYTEDLLKKHLEYLASIKEEEESSKKI